MSTKVDISCFDLKDVAYTINKTRKNAIFHYSEFHVSLFHDHQLNDGNNDVAYTQFWYPFVCDTM